MNRHSEAIFKQLAASKWQGDDGERDTERRLLILEHLRRTALWSHWLGVTRRPLLADVAEMVDSSVATGPDLLDKVSDLFVANPVGIPVLVTAKNALRWAALKDSSNIDSLVFEDPYEPLLLAFEIGGGFGLEAGFIELEGMMFRHQAWNEYILPGPIVVMSGEVVVQAQDVPHDATLGQVWTFHVTEMGTNQFLAPEFEVYWPLYGPARVNAVQHEIDQWLDEHKLWFQKTITPLDEWTPTGAPSWAAFREAATRSLE